jgi:Cellulase (glycosyl hydrolase family 5)/Protein of unknown function (DUF3060)
MRSLLLASTMLVVPLSGYAQTCARSPVAGVNALYTTTKTGTFTAQNGQIIGPNGQVFTPEGVDIWASNIGGVTAAQLQATFPGINSVRVYDTNYEPPSYYASFVQQMSAAGIVVTIVDATNYAGDGGGGQGVVFTGAALQTEMNWYTSLASYYKNNPYVWLGSNNEPSYNTAGGPSLAALSQWQTQTYDAIRATGDNNIVMLDEPAGGVPGTMGPSSGLTASDYAGMTNIVWDLHYYGWALADGYTLPSMVIQAASMPADGGTAPVVIGEYGDSTNGASVDSNWQQVVSSVAQSGVGSTAWAYPTGGGSGDQLMSGSSLSAYGQMVASLIKQTAGGCTDIAESTSQIAADTTAAQALVNDANNLTVAQVAQLAASGQTADGQSTSSIAGLAGSVLNPGATDPTTAAVLAGGPVTTALPVVLAQNAPGGTMPPPPPVNTSTTISVTGEMQTYAAGAGNGTGTISGNDNTVIATGGTETLMVTGSGNTIITGAYDDTVTVTALGNTINLGGGANTVVLAYPSEQPVQQINADASALPPMASAGNVFVAPQPGMGTLTIQGVLAANDTIDLTSALAGTTWNHQASTMWQYIAVASSPTGCTIAVNGQVIVTLPNGAPSGQLGNVITAH